MPSFNYLRLEQAFGAFAESGVKTQTSSHVKPTHQHIALRLVLEGGFAPDEITPHPPVSMYEHRGKRHLKFDETVATSKEQTVLGGLKSKAIDVVANKRDVGPVIAVSVKGTTGAFRNLTNRMEEAIGDSTNLHIMYPGLVYGFLHLLKINREGEPNIQSNDVSVNQAGEVVNSVRRYHDVLVGLSGRRLVRDDYTRYEAVGFAMVESAVEDRGKIFRGFPPEDSPLAPDRFFSSLYQVYDLRYPYIAASIGTLKRHTWAVDSPLFEELGGASEAQTVLGYTPRIE